MIDIIYNAVARMVKALSNIGQNPVLIEACDFGNAYGFLFNSPDKYTNQYWCVDKKTNRPFNFTENQNIEAFKNRRIITNEITKGGNRNGLQP